MHEAAVSIVKGIAVVGITVFGMHSCFNSDWMKETERRNAAQAAADAQPRVIREVDGCKVYTFKSGDWHYFTRCGEVVTTERHYDVRVGKTTQHKQETIVTEGNK
jgi:hypothetical protein